MKGVKHSQNKRSPDSLVKKIFEQIRTKNSELDRREFVALVVNEYILGLAKLNIKIPKSLQELTEKELADEVEELLG